MGYMGILVLYWAIPYCIYLRGLQTLNAKGQGLGLKVQVLGERTLNFWLPVECWGHGFRV